MRLLAQAAQSPAPRTEQEAVKLFLQPLNILRPTRALLQARNLNEKIKRALVEMREVRYGREVFIDGQPLGSLLRACEADYKRRLAEEKAEREARRAAQEQARAESGQATEDGEQGRGDREQDAGAQEATSDSQAEGDAEGQEGEPADTPTDQVPKGRGRGPELPKTFEEFWDVFSRAFAPPKEVRELDGDRMLLRQLAEGVWAHLHLYERQMQQESEKLDAAFQKGTQPVASLKDPPKRAWAVLAAFRIESWFTDALRELERYLDQDMSQLVK